jgi:hypothetical protein
VAQRRGAAAAAVAVAQQLLLVAGPAYLAAQWGPLRLAGQQPATASLPWCLLLLLLLLLLLAVVAVAVLVQMLHKTAATQAALGVSRRS